MSGFQEQLEAAGCLFFRISHRASQHRSQEDGESGAGEGHPGGRGGAVLDGVAVV